MRNRAVPLLLLMAVAGWIGACRRESESIVVTPATDQSCTALMVQGQAHSVYRQAVQALAQGQSPQQVAHLRCLIGDAAAAQTNPEQAYRQLVGQRFDADILYGLLSNQLSRNLAQDRQVGKQRDAGLAWPGAYLSEAAVVAYQKTGETRFLDLFVSYYDAVLTRRDDRLNRFDTEHQRVMKAWGAVNIEKDRWIAHVTHNARITYPATEFARLVKADPGLKRFESKANHYLAAAQETLDAFEADLVPVPGQPGIRWYRRPFDDNLEATNHLHVVGNTWLNLAELTGEARYSQHVEELIKIFLSGVHREPGGLVSWNYFPSFAKQERQNTEYRNGQEYSEPIWKASLTAPFLLRAQGRGYAVPAELTQAIGRTFSTLSFQGNQLWRNLAQRDSRFVDVHKDKSKMGFLKNATTLVEYGSVAPALPGQIATLVAARRDLFPRGWLSSPAMLLSYAYYLRPSSMGGAAGHPQPGAGRQSLAAPIAEPSPLAPSQAVATPVQLRQSQHR